MVPNLANLRKKRLTNVWMGYFVARIIDFIYKCLRSALLSPEREAMPIVRLVASLGDRGCGGMQQIMYDIAPVHCRFSAERSFYFKVSVIIFFNIL